MRYEFKSNLSSDGIQDVIQKLTEYRDVTLPMKVQKVRKAVAEQIRNLAQSDYSSAVYELWHVAHGQTIKDHWKPNINVRVDDYGDRTLVIASGEDVLFVEFGTGVSYNGAAGSSPHPKGVQNGMLIGTYGKGHGARNAWWFKQDEITYGTKGIASRQSLYLSAQLIAETLGNVARGAWDS